MAKRKAYRWQNERKALKNQPRITHEPKAHIGIVAWWLIPARDRTQCSECNAKQPTGTAVAFSHATKTVLCAGCYGSKGIHPQASKALLTKGRKVTPILQKPKKRKTKAERKGDQARTMMEMKARNAKRALDRQMDLAIVLDDDRDPPPIVQPKGTPGSMLRRYELMSLSPLRYRETSVRKALDG